jgi:hypothetical protein
VPTGHRTAELRSLAFHGLVAQRLDDELLERARTRVDRWLADGGPVDVARAERWRGVLGGPTAGIVAVLTTDDEESQDLRQNTPFAGALSPRERWSIVREVR